MSKLKTSRVIITRFTGKDETGASLLIEYILTIVIAAILFTLLLLNLQAIMTKSDRIVMGEEMDIAASIIANQISDYSNELMLNEYTGDFAAAGYPDVPAITISRGFKVPKPYGERQYIVEVTPDPTGDRGKVKVMYGSDPDLYTIVTYNSQYPIEPCKITCNTYDLIIEFDPLLGVIKLKEV